MTLLTLLSICDSFTVVTMTLLTVTEYVWQFYGRHHDFVNRCWVFVTVLRSSPWLLTGTEYLWQFYCRHHDFVNRYWVFVTVLMSSPWLCEPLLSICVSFTVVTMSLLTVTEYLWQFYGRHHDFVNRYWVFVSFMVVTITLLTITEYLWQF